MARFGQGITPQLGAINYSPILQGSLAAAEGQMRGSEAVARGIAALGAQVGKGIEQYQQNKMVAAQGVADFEGAVQANPRLLEAAQAPNAPKEIGRIFSKLQKDGSLGVRDASMLSAWSRSWLTQDAQVRQEQARAAQEQAAMQERLGMRTAASLIASGSQNPLASMSAMGVPLTPGVVGFVTSQQAQTAATQKTLAEAEKMRRGPQKTALDLEKERLEVEALRAKVATQKSELDPNSIEARRKQAELDKLQRESAQALRKELDAATSSQRRLESERDRAQNVLGAIQQARTFASRGGLAGFTSTGFTGKAYSFIPGTPAYELSQVLGTIKANIGFDRLQKMREESPTGGALGQVAVQELRDLQNSIASLEQGQSGGRLVANLEKIENFYKKWLPAIETDMATATKQAESVGAQIGRFFVSEVK